MSDAYQESNLGTREPTSPVANLNLQQDRETPEISKRAVSQLGNRVIRLSANNSDQLKFEHIVQSRAQIKSLDMKTMSQNNPVRTVIQTKKVLSRSKPVPEQQPTFETKKLNTNLALDIAQTLLAKPTQYNFFEQDVKQLLLQNRQLRSIEWAMNKNLEAALVDTDDLKKQNADPRTVRCS